MTGHNVKVRVGQVLVKRYGTASRMRECRSLSATSLGTPTNFLGSLDPTRSIFGSLVVHASLPQGRDVAPSVPWLMLSWAGAMVALATFGRPVVTLHTPRGEAAWVLCSRRRRWSVSASYQVSQPRVVRQPNNSNVKQKMSEAWAKK